MKTSRKNDAVTMEFSSDEVNHLYMMLVGSRDDIRTISKKEDEILDAFLTDLSITIREIRNERASSV
jgi:hypothetical protein